MSHFFSTTTTTVVKLVEKWTGYSREDMPPRWRAAAEKFVEPNGSAEKDLGKIKSVEIKYAGPESSSLEHSLDSWALHRY